MSCNISLNWNQPKSEAYVSCISYSQFNSHPSEETGKIELRLLSVKLNFVFKNVETKKE